MNTMVSFYNGARVDSKEFELHNDTWEGNDYKIFDPSDTPDGAMDIPVWAQVGQGEILTRT